MATAVTIAVRLAPQAGSVAEVARAAAAVVDEQAAALGPWTVDGAEVAAGALTPELGADGAVELERRWRVWRLLGTHEVEDEIGLALTVRSDDGGARLELTLEDAGPFCALTDADGRPTEHPHHARVLENLESLTGLTLALAERLAPAGLCLYTDAGAPVPWNAHLVYCPGERAALVELGALRELAVRGRPAEGLPPLAQVDPADEGLPLHRWRARPERERLRDDLVRLAGAGEPDERRVRALIDSGRFDVWELERGFAIGEHPWLLNAFIDRFWIELAG